MIFIKVTEDPTETIQESINLQEKQSQDRAALELVYVVA